MAEYKFRQQENPANLDIIDVEDDIICGFVGWSDGKWTSIVPTDDGLVTKRHTSRDAALSHAVKCTTI